MHARSAKRAVARKKKPFAGERKVHNGRMPPPAHSWGKIANLYGRPLPRGRGWCAPCVCAHHALTPCRHPPHRGQRRRLRARAFGKGCINTGAMWCRSRDRFFTRQDGLKAPQTARAAPGCMRDAFIASATFSFARGQDQLCTRPCSNLHMAVVTPASRCDNCSVHVSQVRSAAFARARVSFRLRASDMR